MDKGIINVVMDRSAYHRAAAAIERINPNSSPGQFEAAKVLCLIALASARIAENDAFRIYGGTQDPDAHKHAGVADTRPSTAMLDKQVETVEPAADLGAFTHDIPVVPTPDAADQGPGMDQWEQAIDINELKPLLGLDPTTKVTEGARGVPLQGAAAWTHVTHGVSQKRSDGTTAIYTDGVVRTPGGHTLTLQKGKVVEARNHDCINPYCPICRAPARAIIRY